MYGGMGEKAAENGAFGGCFQHPFHRTQTRASGRFTVALGSVWSGTACVVWNGLCGLKRPVWPWDLCGPEWPVWRTCASQAKNKLEAYGLYTTSTICGSRFHGAV
jgi:hypothetical protein